MKVAHKFSTLFNFLAQKNRGLPVNAETGSPIRIHFRPHVSGRSRSRTRRSSNPVTIEMPLISNGNANSSPSNHTQVSRSPSNQSQRTRSSQGSVCLSPSGQHLTVGKQLILSIMHRASAVLIFSTAHR